MFDVTVVSLGLQVVTHLPIFASFRKQIYFAS